MSYWNAVLEEVLQKEQEREFFYTNHGRIEDFLSLPDASHIKKTTPRRTYYLNHPFENIYLTAREAETVFWLLQNHTVASCAQAMGLSPRTVEFYVKNMKIKLRCSNKKEMLENILQTNLLSQLEKDGFRIAKH